MARALWHRLQRLGFWVRICSAVPLLLPFWLTGQRDVIRADADRWMAISAEQVWGGLPHRRRPIVQLLFLFSNPRMRAFRSLFYYRTEHGGIPGRVSAKALRPLYKGEVALELYADSIGPGLYIAHGHGTGITWKATVGANCWLHQHVTIGWHEGAPRIGDNVTIYTGAVVIGDITIGDGVIVGANAVVTKDVPAGVIARGVPATYHPRNDESDKTQAAGDDTVPTARSAHRPLAVGSS